MPAAPLDSFLAFSAEVTAFTAFELRGTGQAEAYLDTVRTVVGEPLLADLLNTYDGLAAATATPPADRQALLRREIFGSERLGPVARAIVKLWYLGVWFGLPEAWSEAYGPAPHNVTFVVSPAAFVEGLLWPAIGAHPPGAKAPGFGSWAEPPRIPPFGAPIPSPASDRRTSP